MNGVFVWTIGDAITCVIVLSLAAIVGALGLFVCIKQAVCRHEQGVNETNACDAICRNCGKNLGFIDKWRIAKP